jgi:mannose/fructose-specific phosphotransferase system component IIA
MTGPGGPPVPGILVAHGQLARELKVTAESIAGSAGDLLCLSNEGRSTDSLALEIGRALDETGPGTVILVDLAGGSCMTAALKAVRTRPGNPVVAGMNLALVLDFIQKRHTQSLSELVSHVIGRGRDAVVMVNSSE